jgi:hypothetical protein
VIGELRDCFSRSFIRVLPFLRSVICFVEVIEDAGLVADKDNF